MLKRMRRKKNEMMTMQKEMGKMKRKPADQMVIKLWKIRKEKNEKDAEIKTSVIWLTTLIGAESSAKKPIN